MPTKNPRIHVVLEPPLFAALKKRSRRNGLSMSLEAREMIRDSVRNTKVTSTRSYKGKHMHELIGAFRMGKSHPDDILSDQVHG
jgi:hypothetical protein